MQLTATPEDEAFRAEVRAFVRASVPSDMAARVRSGVHIGRDDLKAWNRILAERGWAAAHWPKEYGGAGWTPAQIFIFEEECAAADAPFLSYFGLRLIGPLLYTFGTEAQKARYLGDIVTGETFWCQGFSEPSAGSDLASVQTTAVRDADNYIVNGQKLWTTEAHFADMMFCLCRTDTSVRPQKGGLSILMFPMDQPGITVRPIITMDGGHSVNEVFLDNICVPATEVLGHPGQGWDQAKFLLANERVTNAHVPTCKRTLTVLRAMAQARGLLDRTDIADRLALLEIEVHGLEWMVLRELYSPHKAGGSLPSALKLLGSEIQQRLADFAVELAGPQALVDLPHGMTPGNEMPARMAADVVGVAARQLFSRAASIYAGTNEIQREIIARQVLTVEQ